METTFTALVSDTEKADKNIGSMLKKLVQIGLVTKGFKGLFGGGGQQVLASGQAPNLGGTGNVAPMATANFGDGPRLLGGNKLLGGAGDLMGGFGGGRRAALGAGLGAVGGMAAAIAYAMPDRGDALDYRLARANGAFQMGGLGMAMGERSKYVSGMQRKAMSAGTSMGSMDAVNAQRLLASGGFGPGSMNYNTLYSSAAGLSNIMPGLGIAGGAQVAMNFQSGRVTNEMRMYGIQTSNARTGKAYGMNVIGEQLYQKVMDRQRQLGVTDSKEQQRRINFSLEKDRGLDRLLNNLSGGDEASKEALKTMLQYRMQTGSKSLTLLNTKEQEKLGIQTDDTKSQSKLNSRSFNALQSQSKGLAEGFRDLNSAMGVLQNTIAKFPSLLGRLDGGLGSILGGLGGSIGGGALKGLLWGRGGRSLLSKVGDVGEEATVAESAAKISMAPFAATAVGIYATGVAGERMGRGFRKSMDKHVVTRKVFGSQSAYDKDQEWLQQYKKNLLKQDGKDGVPASDLTSVRLGNQGWQVAKQYESKFQGFLNDAQSMGLISNGGKITSSGGYNDRLIRGGSRKSNHAFGAAIDVNAAENGLGQTSGSVVPSVARALAAKWGLRWGGDYRGRKDLMHFEVPGANGEGVRKAGGGGGAVATSAASTVATSVSGSGRRASAALGFSVGSTNNVLNQLSSKSGMNNAYDCSSYVQEIMKQNGITLPDTSWEQSKKGTQVYNITDAVKGDLLFFHFAGGHRGDGSTNRINHVGIYVGEGRMTDYTAERGASTGYIPMGNLVMIRRVLTSTNAVGSSAGGGTSEHSSGSEVMAGGRSGGGSPGTYGAPAAAGGAPSSLSSMLNGLEQLESGGKNIHTRAKGSSASGYFQITNSTWGNYKGYAHAIDAPREIQQEKAMALLSGNLKKFGSPELALAAYFAGAGNSKAKLQSLIDSNQSPTAGTQTANMGVGSYVRQILGGKTTSRATGGWNIPQDEFSRLHAGEMVLPSKIAEAVRGAMKEGSGHPTGGSSCNGSHKIEVSLVIKGNSSADYDQALAGITSAINRSANYDMIRSS